MLPSPQVLINDNLVLRANGNAVIEATCDLTASVEGYVTVENTGDADLWIDEFIVDATWAFLFKSSGAFLSSLSRTAAALFRCTTRAAVAQ